MRKNLTIGGKSVTFECNALTPIFYKAEFGKDFMGDMMKLMLATDILTDPKKANPEDFEKVDFDIFSRLAWACAKTADKNGTESYIDWLGGHPEFSVVDHGLPVMELVQKNFETKKK